MEETDHDVSGAYELQARLEHHDVQDVDEVAGVVGQEPEVQVLRRLIGKGPPHWDQPHVPVPRSHHQEQPEDVDQV